MADETTQTPPADASHYALVEQYVEATKRQLERERALSAAMQAIAPDNAVFSLQCKELHELLSTFALKAFGESAVDWLSWWMWECDFGGKPAKVWLDGHEFDVSALENLYKFCLRDTKSEPQP